MIRKGRAGRESGSIDAAAAQGLKPPKIIGRFSAFAAEPWL
jgi:hypothetical protein